MLESDYHTNAISFIRQHLSNWSQASVTNTSLKLLTGNSNKVFLITTTLPIYPSSVIYRVFGPNEITDKSRERKIFSHLSLQGLGPKNYADSVTERLEQNLEGFEPMNNSYFTQNLIIKKISKRLKKIHSVDMSEILTGEELMTDKNPQKWRNLIISKLNLVATHPKLAEIHELISEESAVRFNEVLPRDSPVVYSHLDPSPLNFLYNEAKKKVYFVDYEFSGFSYRSMDFALMLNEMQFDFLYELPPFYQHRPELECSDDLIKEYVKEYGEGKEMWIEIKQSLIASHYIWAMWSMAMYKGPTNGYDYLEYSLLRFKLFKEKYNDFIENNKTQGIRIVADQLYADENITSVD